MARTQVSFATCNLYNINLPGLKMYRDSDGWSDEEFKLKVQWISGLIGRVDADIWDFQELWHYQALERFFSIVIETMYLDSCLNGKARTSFMGGMSLLQQSHEPVREFY